MEVKLLDCTKIINVMDSIRECYDSFDKSDNGGPVDQSLVRRIIENGHTSTLEHGIYHFQITGFSRAVLQELSRHRIASPSVRSTRYTLKKMLRSNESLENFIVMTGNTNVDLGNIATLARIKGLMLEDPNIKNDHLKYMIPEALKVDERLTINARSLRNLLKLRLSPRALWEIRELAAKIFDCIPEAHKLLFEDIGNTICKKELQRLIEK